MFLAVLQGFLDVTSRYYGSSEIRPKIEIVEHAQNYFANFHAQIITSVLINYSTWYFR